METKYYMPLHATPEAVAHHEAAHAVMAFLFGYRVKTISIYNNNSGYTEFDQIFPLAYIRAKLWHEGISDCDINLLLRRNAMIALAGYTAEFKFIKKKLPYGLSSGDPSNDFDKTLRQIIEVRNLQDDVYLEEIKYEAALDMKQWQDETQTELNKPIVWDTIEEVANELLKSTSGIIYPDTFIPVFQKILTPYLEIKYGENIFPDFIFFTDEELYKEDKKFRETGLIPEVINQLQSLQKRTKNN